MKLSEIPSQVAQNFGYDVNAMTDTEKVTLVRRRIVYEEVVISKDEFEKMNEEIVNDHSKFYLCELPMNDIGFPDFVDEETQYTAFPGDVTSFTDDAIAFLFEDQSWSDSFEPVQLAS